MKVNYEGPLRGILKAALLPLLVFSLTNCAAEGQSTQFESTTSGSLNSQSAVLFAAQEISMANGMAQDNLVLSLTPVQEEETDHHQGHQGHQGNHGHHGNEHGHHGNGHHGDEISVHGLYLNVTHIALKMENGEWVSGPDFRSEENPNGYSIMIGGLAGTSTIEVVRASVDAGEYQRVRVYLGGENYFSSTDDVDTLFPLNLNDEGEEGQFIDFKVKGKDASAIPVVDKYRTTVYATVEMDDVVRRDDHNHNNDIERLVNAYRLHAKARVDDYSMELIPEPEPVVAPSRGSVTVATTDSTTTATSVVASPVVSPVVETTTTSTVAPTRTVSTRGTTSVVTTTTTTTASTQVVDSTTVAPTPLTETAVVLDPTNMVVVP